MFAQRAAISLTLGPLTLFLIYLGGWFYFIPIFVFLTLAVGEYAHMMKEMGRNIPVWLLSGIVAVFLLAAQFGSLVPDVPVLPICILLGTFSLLCHALWSYERERTDRASADFLASVGGMIIVGWLGSHFLLLRGLDAARGSEAAMWTGITILGTWSADTFAYLVGKFLAGGVLGRHKMTPQLSPNKTWEGYLGGIILAVFSPLLSVYRCLD